MKHALSSLGIPNPAPGAYGATALLDSEAALLHSLSPIDNSELGSVRCAQLPAYDRVVQEAVEAFERWRMVTAPVRGDIVRQMALALRDSKDFLGELITREMGKIKQEGLGEVQEAIDIADFAVGLSRQLCGSTMPSERPGHRLLEQWHPIGPVGVITAFNFPLAVWAWNSMLAAVCGDSVLWKPSELTPLVAVAVNSICRSVLEKNGHPPAVFSLLVDSSAELGKRMAADSRIPLISATGSCAMGRSVAESVGKRLGKSILELGGNNAVIVLADADLELATSAILFGAVATAGQRCTSIRRVLVERKIEAELTRKLVKAYEQVKIGNPLMASTLMGPLVHVRAVQQYRAALTRIVAEGGEIRYGGKVLQGMPSDLYVEPVIVGAHAGMQIINEETFAPIMYMIGIDSLEEAIALNNSVPQGLSSSIFTRNLQYSERFLSQQGSDCGIANVNIGTSGAEIGGAFGGEKDTGGGRESGSDSWKQYMRRQTVTINYSDALPLAQGIVFG